jgi:hypothetical protein
MPLRIVVHRGEEVTAGCRKLHNEGLHDLYSSSGIIGMIKLRVVILSGQDI